VNSEPIELPSLDLSRKNSNGHYINKFKSIRNDNKVET